MSAPLGHKNDIAMTNVLNFIKNDLPSLMKTRNIIVNGEIYYSGHSSGCRNAIQLSKKSLPSGLILLDPVDTDPTEHLINPILTEPLYIPIPVLIVASGLGSKTGLEIGPFHIPACCPIHYSSRHFYSNLKGGLMVMANATFFGIFC